MLFSATLHTAWLLSIAWGACPPVEPPALTVYDHRTATWAALPPTLDTWSLPQCEPCSLAPCAQHSLELLMLWLQSYIYVIAEKGLRNRTRLATACSIGDAPQTPLRAFALNTH